MTDLQAEMKRMKSKVDSLMLDRLLPKGSTVREVDLLYKMMRDYPSRKGKGMRPFLCITTCRAIGGAEDDALLTAACLELFQNWILIHDDLEDGSELRRGEPTLHRKHPASLAINAGDALHARMWGALLENSTRLGPDKTLRILEEFSGMVNETTEGQHMELGWVEGRRWDLTEADYFQMCTRKTSWYTVAGPCRLGAIVAGAGREELDALRSFGTALGVAFQIQDDALNLVGDEQKYGKAKSDDIAEGKRTLIVLHLMDSADSGTRARLMGIMNKGRSEKTPEDVDYVMSLVESTDAVGYARKRASELMKRALATLKTVDWRGDTESVRLLESFAKFAVEREW